MNWYKEYFSCALMDNSDIGQTLTLILYRSKLVGLRVTRKYNLLNHYQKISTRQIIHRVIDFAGRIYFYQSMGYSFLHTSPTVT